jgi:hypothetical protein
MRNNGPALLQPYDGEPGADLTELGNLHAQKNEPAQQCFVGKRGFVCAKWQNTAKLCAPVRHDAFRRMAEPRRGLGANISEHWRTCGGF